MWSVESRYLDGWPYGNCQTVRLSALTAWNLYLDFSLYIKKLTLNLSMIRIHNHLIKDAMELHIYLRRSAWSVFKRPQTNLFRNMAQLSKKSIMLSNMCHYLCISWPLQWIYWIIDFVPMHFKLGFSSSFLFFGLSRRFTKIYTFTYCVIYYYLLRQVLFSLMRCVHFQFRTIVLST